MRKTLIGTIGLCVLSAGLLAGCGAPDQISKVDTSGSQSSKAPAKADTATSTSKAQLYKIGDTVNFNGLHITMNSARTSAGDDIETPQNGKFLMVDLTLENKTDQPIVVSTMAQMSLKDDKSYSHDVTIYTGVKGSLDGTIAPGQTLRGEAAFDVPNSSSYQFVFANPFSTGQAIWQFRAK